MSSICDLQKGQERIKQTENDGFPCWDIGGVKVSCAIREKKIKGGHRFSVQASVRFCTVKAAG